MINFVLYFIYTWTNSSAVLNCKMICCCYFLYQCRYYKFMSFKLNMKLITIFVQKIFSVRLHFYFHFKKIIISILCNCFRASGCCSFLYWILVCQIHRKFSLILSFTCLLTLCFTIFFSFYQEWSILGFI